VQNRLDLSKTILHPPKHSISYCYVCTINWV